MKPTTRIVALSHVSNVFGSVQDVRGAANVTHDGGAVLVVDGAQAIGHMSVDVGELGVDYYAASAHKGPLGPVGIGLLYINEPEEFSPVSVGGGTVHGVDRDCNFGFEPFPASAEAGTPNIAGALGFARGVEYVSSLGTDSIHEHEMELGRYAAGELDGVNGVVVYGSDNRSGMVSFNVGNMRCHDVSLILDETSNICTRSGMHCAAMAVKTVGAEHGTVRASFGCYTTQEEVDALVKAVAEISATLT
jgi:cysteine desulfurase/selenocysteine lyase